MTATRGSCRPVPVTVTVTPGITPPDESVTLPKIDPMPCACADPGKVARSSAVIRLHQNHRVMWILPGC